MIGYAHDGQMPVAPPRERIPNMESDLTTEETTSKDTVRGWHVLLAWTTFFTLTVILFNVTHWWIGLEVAIDGTVFIIAWALSDAYGNGR
jgi:hypothetical protein